MPRFRRWRGRRGLGSALLTLGLLVAAGYGALHPAPAGPGLAGRPHVSDGDSLRLGGRRIRLIGIDAPELSQTCTDRSGATWPCGRVSRDRLEALIGGASVMCGQHGLDKYGRTLATCTIGGRDVAAEQVRTGMAVSYGGYQAEQAAARAQGLGIWQGKFQMPRSYRDGEAEAAQPAWLEWLRQWFK